MNIYKVETRDDIHQLNGSYSINALDVVQAEQKFKQKYPKLRIIRIVKIA